MDRSELKRTVLDGHQRTAALIGRIPNERLGQPATDTWTGKDVVAHLAWWHDHSARVIESLRAGRQPYDRADPANTTDSLNDQAHGEHLDDPPDLTRLAFSDSFGRLLAALEPCTDEELFAVDHWPWLEGEALAETILWDTARHYDAHFEHLERLAP
jgi:hypothetical protein